ncbi:ABC transporter permease [Chondromyces apiculatus]|uniref:ABC-type antimicrobial peptide transport system, permease component n=1 Tax=Chondromyces apiculatus DSM 436 TaxID=1192034 RepID=A0A017T616_9BACT|nr:FtsX-like permease family protein [Chondromyces apiculatus]EYF04703.1 ABC-type antimicrobial peptide transport system, permease component [Chondromyces apiculatus DSM 436]
MSLLSIAARNLLRNKFRTIFTVLGAAVAVLAFVFIQTMLTSWSAGVEFAAKDRIATRHKVSMILPLPKRYADTIREVPGVKHASYFQWFGGVDPKDKNNFFANTAVESKTVFDIYDEMVVAPEDKARWLADRQGAIVGAVLAKKMGLKVGDRVTLQGTIFPGDWQFNVSGIYTASRRSIDQSQFFFHWDYLNESVPEPQRDQVAWISARLDDPTRSAEVSAAIDRIFDEKDVQTATMSERAMNLSFMAMFSAVLSALDAVSIIILVIMVMILGNTIAMGVRERTREYGVLRAVGFQPKHVGLFILGEALTIGVLAGVVGLGISYPLVELMFGRFLEENMGGMFPYFRIAPMTMVAAVLLAVTLSVVASLIPAYRAAKLSVTDALRRVA